MDKRNLITVTLLISALAFNPLTAREKERGTVAQLTCSTFVKDVALTLQNKGLEEDAALKISASLVNEKDGRFILMAENLLASNIISKDELLEYLGKEALFRRSVDLHTYGQLVSMVTKIKQQAVSPEALKKLSYIAKVNTLIANT